MHWLKLIKFEMEKKRIGIMSCNIYCNFTNYGSALQTYAMQKVINNMDNNAYEAVVMDYCPKTMLDKDILNPFKHMWDKDPVARKMCELTLPAIRINNDKFNRFYSDRFNLSSQKYTSKNFQECVSKEKLDGFVVGSDTVFCLEEFDLDDGYFANYPEMKNKTVSYAASFGDSHFTDESFGRLDSLLGNFKALGIRENNFIDYVKSKVSVPVERTIDPTLLLDASDYNEITATRIYAEPYVLMYARRYNKSMEDYTRKIAQQNGWKIVEISLRATNAELGHEVRYDAGVEEFLSLVKNAEMLVTNSFHGMIFAVQYCTPFVAFSRDQCDNKIEELLDLFGIDDRLFITGSEPDPVEIDFAGVHDRIMKARTRSLDFFKKELEICFS